MKNHSPQAFYKKQIKLYNRLFNQFSIKTDRLSVIRVVGFIASMVLIYYSTTFSITTTFISILFFLVAFGFIVYYHGRVYKKKDFYETLLNINNAELKSLSGNYNDFEDGEEYNLPEHPYTDDLDVFGKNSLFQSINRCSTIIGKDKLANWFSCMSLNKHKIAEKQKAVKELSGLTEWRQIFRTLGIQSEESREDQVHVAKWASEKQAFNNPIYLCLVIFVPIITFSLLFLSILGYISEQLFVLYIFLIPFGISLKNLKKVNSIHKQDRFC